MFPCKSEIARPRPARNSCGEAVATLCSTPRACFRRAANSIEVGRRGARRKSCIQKRSELNHITGSTHGSWLAPRECHFAQADQTIVPDIYFVRDTEAERHMVSANDLVERINRNGHSALHLSEFEQIVEHLRNNVRTDDLVVTMGAGNVWEIGRDLVGE